MIVHIQNQVLPHYRQADQPYICFHNITSNKQVYLINNRRNYRNDENEFTSVNRFM